MSSPLPPVPPLWVDSPGALPAALASLAVRDWLALDTEFMRERTYHPLLCLIQLAGPGGCVVIDPIAVRDLAPLAEFLAEETSVKVLHAGRQDLEALARAELSLGGPLFDTQLAAALTGLPDQVSYAWLVEHLCGVVLDKSQTRTDWSQRPLSLAQLDYAAEDVRHLESLHRALGEALVAAGKLDWLWEETRALPARMAQEEPSSEAWRRIKLSPRAAPEVVARARALAVWREGEARRADLPRGWILKDEAVAALARLAPGDPAALARIPGLPPATLRRHGATLIALLKDATVSDSPAAAPGWRLGRAGTELVGKLQEAVRQRAADTGVSATLLATRRDLERLVLGETVSRLAEGWRAGVLGDALREMVDSVPLAERRQGTGAGGEEEATS